MASHSALIFASRRFVSSAEADDWAGFFSAGVPGVPGCCAKAHEAAIRTLQAHAIRVRIRFLPQRRAYLTKRAHPLQVRQERQRKRLRVWRPEPFPSARSLLGACQAVARARAWEINPRARRLRWAGGLPGQDWGRSGRAASGG